MPQLPKCAIIQKMGIEKIVRVKLTKGNLPETNGQVKLITWDKNERVWRASKALMICWFLAVGGILIPILHFVIVPFFLLLGPLLFFVLYSESKGQLGGKGICPECKKEFDIEPGKKTFPFDDVCNHCKAHSQIDIIPE